MCYDIHRLWYAWWGNICTRYKLYLKYNVTYVRYYAMEFYYTTLLPDSREFTADDGGGAPATVLMGSV